LKEPLLGKKEKFDIDIKFNDIRCFLNVIPIPKALEEGKKSFY
jgi:hypothetical protein